MSVERIKGEVVFTCDECEETHETGADDWQEALADAKANAWAIRKVDDEWKHYCPICRPDARWVDR